MTGRRHHADDERRYEAQRQRERQREVTREQDVRGINARHEPRAARIDDMDRMDVRPERGDPAYRMDPRLQDSRVQDPRLQDPRLQDPRLQDPRLQDPRLQDPRQATRGEYEIPRNRADDMDMDDDPYDRYQQAGRTGHIINPGHREAEQDEYASRRVYDMDPPRKPAGTNYNDFFLSGEGINREVLQIEITKYLGQDATVRTHTMKDGRKGYLIRGYRALTSAMIQSIKEVSRNYENDQNRRRQAGYGPVGYGAYAEDVREREERTLRDREERNYAARHDTGYAPRNPMDLDDERGPQYRNVPLPAGYGGDQRDLRDPRDMREPPRGVPVASSRHVVTTYPPQETTYPGYAVAPVAPSTYGQLDAMPRILQQGSGTTPPPGGGRVVPAGYGTSGYPPNTQATRQPATTAYESRQGAGYGAYADPRSDRHRSRP